MYNQPETELFQLAWNSLSSEIYSVFLLIVYLLGPSQQIFSRFS